MENTKKAELIITALQQRIGEITANYETQIALLRAELTMLMESQEEKDKATESYAEEIANKIAL